MLTIRKCDDRGHFDHGWLDTYHTFSFGDYFDPNFKGFRSLRVINEDRIEPGQGFGLHPHRDMEIITYVLSGALEHRDSLGNGEVIRPGTIQYMAAGSGIQHSEFNPSPTEPVHLIQIWIRPNRTGVTPSYEQRDFPALGKSNGLTLLASPDGRDGSIPIHQDARVCAASPAKAERLQHLLPGGRGAWVQVLRGAVDIDGQRVRAGDGASVTDAPGLKIDAVEDSELLLFDLQ